MSTGCCHPPSGHVNALPCLRGQLILSPLAAYSRIPTLRSSRLRTSFNLPRASVYLRGVRGRDQGQRWAHSISLLHVPPLQNPSNQLFTCSLIAAALSHRFASAASPEDS